jgi:hypothetical protein
VAVQIASNVLNCSRFKLRKWWAQSFLVGTRQIVCGFRDDRGTVHKLERFEVMKLHKMAGVSCVLSHFVAKWIEC